MRKNQQQQVQLLWIPSHQLTNSYISNIWVKEKPILFSLHSFQLLLEMQCKGHQVHHRLIKQINNNLLQLIMPSIHQLIHRGFKVFKKWMETFSNISSSCSSRVWRLNCKLKLTATNDTNLSQIVFRIHFNRMETNNSHLLLHNSQLTPLPQINNKPSHSRLHLK